MKKAILKVLLLLSAIAYLPLSIYGMVVCCLFCSWLIYVPVLIVGILLALVDIVVLVAACVMMDIEDEMPTKAYEDYIQTGGRP